MLKKEGKELYKEITSYLKKNSTLETVDEMTINMLCTYFEIYFEQREEVMKKGGTVQVYANKTNNVTGYFTAMNKAADYVLKISFNLGIHEAMRIKLHQYGKLTTSTEKRFN